MRLRPLTEAECYARCYGEHAASDRVSVVRPAAPPARTDAGERLRERFEARLDARGLEEEAA